jgi:hypothetical protein
MDSYLTLKPLSTSMHVMCLEIRPWMFTSPYTSKTFHDLTPGKSLPAATEFLLGFGMKFIQIPKKSLQPNDINEGIDCFDRDMFLKIQFARDDEDNKPYEKL